MPTLAELLQANRPQQVPSPLGQNLLGMDPNAKRMTLLPYPQQGADGNVDMTDWVAPQMMADFVEAIQMPGQVYRGERAGTPEEARKMAVDVNFGSALLGKAPVGAIASGVAGRGSPPAPNELVDALRVRAEQMALAPADRIQPRADVPGVFDNSVEAYTRHAVTPDDTDLASRYPRQTEGKALPKGGRTQAFIDHKEQIAEELAKRMKGELGTNTQYFYHTGPLREAAERSGLSPEESDAWMKDFAEAYAATSPRTNTEQNLRNASLVMAKQKAGIPVRDVIGPGTGGISEKGYPMMTGPGGIHGSLLDDVAAGGINPLTNPKPATFAGNVGGNLSGVTADTHAIRGALDALNAKSPGSIPESFIKKEYREAYKSDPYALNAATWIDDTLASAMVKGKKQQVEYGPVADVYHRAAELLGVSPAEAQSMGWFGSGDKTGLASARSTIVDLMNQRVDVTAQAMGISPEEAAAKMFRREIPLMSNPGDPLSAAAALQRQYEDKKTMKFLETGA